MDSNQSPYCPLEEGWTRNEQLHEEPVSFHFQFPRNGSYEISIKNLGYENAKP
jgi:hypothetical protein